MGVGPLGSDAGGAVGSTCILAQDLGDRGTGNTVNITTGSGTTYWVRFNLTQSNTRLICTGATLTVYAVCGGAVAWGPGINTVDIEESENPQTWWLRLINIIPNTEYTISFGDI